MNELDQRCMERAIVEMRKCVQQPGRDEPTPLVGAVAAKDGRILKQAFRGEQEHGEHAEFTLLERKLPSEILAGATVYTTLEPCTKRCSPKKEPCADRLIRRKVSRVVIGILDPNQEICGRGLRALRNANIVTELFPSKLMAQIEEANHAFIRHQEALVVAVGGNLLKCGISVDLILRVSNRGIVLIERACEPVGWSLPGTFMGNTEDFEAAAQRAAREELGVTHIQKMQQFYAFSDPSRDPRGRVVTTVYVAETAMEPRVTQRAKSIRIVKSLEEISPGALVFDHMTVLDLYFRKRGKL